MNNFQYLFVIVTVLLLENVYTTKAQFGKSASLFTQGALTNLNYARSIRQMHCSLKIYRANCKSETVAEDLLNFSQFAENFEPLELHQSLSLLQSPHHKFLSPCWNIVILISTLEEPILQEKLLGNPVYDQFVFIAINESILQTVLENGGIIDKVAFKYGMFLNEKQNQLKYLLEPSTYTSSFIKSNTLNISKNINNLNGRTLQAPLFNVAPTVVVEHDKEGNITGLRGSHINFTLEVSRRGNVTVNYFREYTDPGGKLENGTWTGFQGAMTNGIGDYTPMTGVLPDLYGDITFLTLSYRETIIFAVREPKPFLKWTALVSPLSKMVWILTICAFGAFTLIFIFIVSYKLYQDEIFSIPIFMEEGIFLPIALFLEQNIRIPATTLTRITAIALIWLAFVVALFYKTNLIGYITFPETPSIPRTFKQLFEHEEYTINLFPFGTMELDILRASPSPIFKGIVERTKIVESLERCVKSATEEHTVCMFWKSIGTAMIMRHVSTFPALKSLFYTQDTATAVDVTSGLKKNSIYYETMNRYASATKEAGLFLKWIKDQMILEREMAEDGLEQGKKGDEDDLEELEDINAIKKGVDKHNDKEKPLEMKNLKAVAYAFAFGCFISFGTLFVECFIKKYFYNANQVGLIATIKIQVGN